MIRDVDEMMDHRQLRWLLFDECDENRTTNETNKKQNKAMMQHRKWKATNGNKMFFFAIAHKKTHPFSTFSHSIIPWRSLTFPLPVTHIRRLHMHSVRSVLWYQEFSSCDTVTAPSNHRYVVTVHRCSHSSCPAQTCAKRTVTPTCLCCFLFSLYTRLFCLQWLWLAHTLSFGSDTGPSRRR